MKTKYYSAADISGSSHYHLDELFGRTGDTESFREIINRICREGSKCSLFRVDVKSIIPALRMVLGWYPLQFRKSILLQKRILAAFVTTVIPGAEENDSNITKMYHDEYYAFAPFSGYFVYVLCRTGRIMFGKPIFCDLGAEQRAAVIETALGSHELISRLIKGAILMAQVSYFGGVYKGGNGCKLIDSPEVNTFRYRDELSYRKAQVFLPGEWTGNGHPS